MSTFTLRGGTSPATEAITLVDFVETFQAKTNSVDLPDCHPVAARNIWEWEWEYEMHDAATAGDAKGVARFARLITDKLADERALDAEAAAKWGRLE